MTGRTPTKLPRAHRALSQGSSATCGQNFFFIIHYWWFSSKISLKYNLRLTGDIRVKRADRTNSFTSTTSLITLKTETFFCVVLQYRSMLSNMIAITFLCYIAFLLNKFKIQSVVCTSHVSSTPSLPMAGGSHTGQQR